MTVTTLTADYWSSDIAAGTGKAENTATIKVGGMYSGKYGPYRTCYRFDLTTIAASPTVTLVRFKLNVTTAGGAAGVWDIHAYNTTGQTNPSPDASGTQYTRDASGNLYNNDDTTWRAISDTWITLGGNVNTDVQDAKAAGTVYAIGLHEEGDNDATPIADGATTKPQLEITYTTGAGGAAVQKRRLLLGVGL